MEPLHYRFLHDQVWRNGLPTLLKSLIRTVWAYSESRTAQILDWGYLRKNSFFAEWPPWSSECQEPVRTVRGCDNWHLSSAQLDGCPGSTPWRQKPGQSVCWPVGNLQLGLSELLLPRQWRREAGRTSSRLHGQCEAVVAHHEVLHLQ